MLALFTAARIEITRARHHLASLAAELEAFAATKPARWDVAIRHEHPVAVFKLAFHIEAVPPQVAAIIGDVVHNLRAALDLAATDAVRANGKSPEGVYFPFSRDAESLPREIERRRFDRAGEQAVELLLSLQPYKGGNIALRGLHDLDVQDKHMALIPTAVSAGSPVLSLWDDEGRPVPSVVGDPTEPSQLLFVFPNESAFAGKEVVPTLEGLAELADGIVEAFASLAARSSR